MKSSLQGAHAALHAQVHQVTKAKRFACAVCGVRPPPLSFNHLFSLLSHFCSSSYLSHFCSSSHLRMQRLYTSAALQAKQSVRRAYATSGKAKDCREVVQRLNLSRQWRDEARGAAALDAAHRRSWSPDLLENRDVKVQGSKSIGGWSTYLQARPPGRSGGSRRCLARASPGTPRPARRRPPCQSRLRSRTTASSQCCRRPLPSARSAATLRPQARIVLRH